MPKISRKKSRKFLFQKLFGESFNKNSSETFSESFLIDSFKDNLDEEYLSEMFDIIREKEYFSLYILEKYSPKFDYKNMDLTYVLPIFIGIGEMFFFSKEIPIKVSINEAIEISKTFGDDSAKRIVNGVLNKVMKNYDELKKDLDEKTFSYDFSFFA